MIETLLNLLLALFAILLPAPAPEPVPAPAPVISTIGGTPVPYGLDCVEDEVISFIGVDTLACVHIDAL